MSPQPGRIVDLFAGPGGWSEGLRMLGLSDVGIEWDRDACLTRAAAGHLTIRADVAQYPPEPFTGAWGLIASPPCQDWSVTGSRLGRDGATGWLVDVVPAWAETVRPKWIACEQVPAVLPVWETHAQRYRSLGYSVAVGKVNAADYGLGETRIRAVLLASLDVPVRIPEPTHARIPSSDLFRTLRQWPTMADTLDWPEPGTSWPYQMPATTVACDPRISARCHHAPGEQGRDARTTDQVRRGEYDGTQPIKLTVDEMAAIQSFRTGYPFQGGLTSKRTQIGNAVPPLLAAHLLAPLTGIPVPELTAVAS